MHIRTVVRRDGVPALVADLAPPLIYGTAPLAHRAFAGQTLDELLALVHRPTPSAPELAAFTLDAATAYQLAFQPQVAAMLQARALSQTRLYRVGNVFGAQSATPLRMLALVAPGDLMVNTPLDFITSHLDIQLDLLFVVPGHDLPAAVPDHDVAFFAVSESDPAALRRLEPLYAAWPRPVLNDPTAIARLSRDTVATGLTSIPGICSPPTFRASRETLRAFVAGEASLMPGMTFPLLLRPVGSHAGHGLQKADSPAALRQHLEAAEVDEFYVSAFVDYRGGDGRYRKLRVGMIEGTPYLCHMACSEQWMVHYLNAGMVEHADRRADEAQAMESFDVGFATRHRDALACLNDWMGLDYFQIDCAETPDGRLLLFEADVAAVVHLMDPPDLFAYKPAQMRRIFTAFDAMARRRAGAM